MPETKETENTKKATALHNLLADLDRAKQRADAEGWIPEEEADRILDANEENGEGDYTVEKYLLPDEPLCI